jgi:hypothetical protein
LHSDEKKRLEPPTREAVRIPGKRQTFQRHFLEGNRGEGRHDYALAAGERIGGRSEIEEMMAENSCSLKIISGTPVAGRSVLGELGRPHEGADLADRFIAARCCCGRGVGLVISQGDKKLAGGSRR